MKTKTKTLILISFILFGLFVSSYSASASTVTKTLYAWVKDAAGNVSNSQSANVDITLPTEPANTYYVSYSTGLDTNNGTSSSTPWKTIAKVNAQTFTPGASILFKKGDTWTGETITVNSSGNSTNPITYSSYGTGAQPVISGFTTISGWVNEGGGIYSKIITSESKTNMVTVDDVNTGMGRYPKTGWLTRESFSITDYVSGYIRDTDLPDSPDWTNAELVFKNYMWSTYRALITSHTSGGYLNYHTISGNNLKAMYSGAYGYFIQNDIRCVTANNDWFHNATTGKFSFYSTSDPSTKVVKVATLDYLIKNNQHDYITIDNIHFIGASKTAIWFNGSTISNTTITNSKIEFCGETGIELFGNPTNSLISSNVVSNCGHQGIYYQSGSNNTTTYNTIQNIGLINGQSFFSTYVTGIRGSVSNGNLYQYNRIDSIGYVGLSATGNEIKIKNNFISNTLQRSHDGGGIYVSGPTLYTGVEVDGNIVIGTKGDPSGTPYSQPIARGIYLDDESNKFTVTNNSVFESGESGIMINWGSENIIRNNTVYDAPRVLYISSDATGKVHNNIIENNLFIAKSSTQYASDLRSGANDISNFGTIDSNKYARILDNTTFMRRYQPSGGYVNYTLPNWVTFSGFDTNSTTSPVTTANESDIRYEYNATTSNKVVSLGSSTYVDVTGATKTGNITLPPYTSIILIKTN